jgi:hypothetical protein
MSNHTTTRAQHVSLKTEKENPVKEIALLASFVAIVFTLVGPATVLAADPTDSEPKSPEAIASIYVVDLVATAAFGVAMNDAGDVTGTSYPDPGCGSSCLPPIESVVWKGGEKIVLPSVPGLSGVTPTDINNLSWISGFGGMFGFGHAAAWKPNGSTYTPIDMGLLPGTTSSIAIGIDDNNRAVGYASTSGGSSTPFMWTEAGGMVNLVTQGFPDETPLGISPGGTVATIGHWYHLGDPGSVIALTPPPMGFGLRSSAVGINDAGDQARFLLRVGPSLVYPFRYHDGTWQQISDIPTGSLANHGVGSINDALDITATLGSRGMIAAGPSGLLQDLAALVSPAYAGSAVTTAGPMNVSGQVLVGMIIGQSERLVKLVPGQPCTSNCIRVTSIQMRGQGPPFCDQGSAQAEAKLIVKDEAGVPLSGVRVTGHFFDDYWLDETVVGQTNSNGHVTFRHVGPPCVGAIAFLVTNAEARPARTFDRTTGRLTNYVIPLP